MWCGQPLPDSVSFQGKRVSHQPFQIPCVFSSKTRLAFNVIVNLFDSRPTTPTFLVFFKKTRVAGILPHSSGSLSLCFVRYNVSWVHKSVWIHMWCCQPLQDIVCFPKENAPRRNRREVSKLEESHMLTKEHRNQRRCWVMWLTPHKTRVTLLRKMSMWSDASDISSKTCVTCR